MASKRKERTLTGFNQVAGENMKKQENNSDSDNNFLNDIVNTKKTKEDTHVFKGFYLEKEIANIIDKHAEGKGRGVKSDIVNESLRKVFRDMGWME